jgi:hypothetical protein
MAATQEEKTTGIDKNETAKPGVGSGAKIDRTAPAGSENSLGAESVRDGRPGTDDNVVEAIDEATPGTTAA